MPYPIVSEVAAASWFKKWQIAREQAGDRVAPPEAPQVEERPIGDNFAWEMEVEAINDKLARLVEKESQKKFESESAVLLHQALPDHEALRDPEFWYWLSTVPGRTVIEKRYFHKKVSYLPDKKNFFGQHAKEVLFFRLWIRAEMGRVEPCGSAIDVYEYVRAGSIDFWRSHLLRVLYAQHRPFLQAFIDFQFPAPERDRARLSTPEIRQMAKDLAKVCANISVEMLNRQQCKMLIERVWIKTSQVRTWAKH